MKIFLPVTALFVLSNSVFAATTPTAPITCPKEIVCSMDKRVSTCKAVTDYPELWTKVMDDAPVTKGSHGFQQAYTSYQSTLSYGTSCYYEGMHIFTKEGGALEALPGDGTAWEVYGYSASCYNNDAASCPLSLIPILNVKTNMTDDDYSVNIVANGVELLDYPIYSSGFLNLYQAWNGCYDDKICQLDFVVTDRKGPINIGSVIVDMQNKMQITKVNGMPVSGYVLAQGKDANSIIISTKK